MKVYVGADHNGYHLKAAIIKYLNKAGYEAADDGGEVLDPHDDFPVFAARVVKDVLSSDDKDARGILICGSGQGMCMAANRFKGIRAAFAHNMQSVRASRNDSDSNVLCLPADDLKKDAAAFGLIDAWLDTPFAGSARFIRRIKEMDEMN